MHFNEAKFEVLQFWADMSAAPDILYMALDGLQLGSWSPGASKLLHGGLCPTLLLAQRLRGHDDLAVLPRTAVVPLRPVKYQPPGGYAAQLCQSDLEPRARTAGLLGKAGAVRLYSQEHRREHCMLCFLWKLSRELNSG